jgi:hypothetical protein
MLRKAKEKKLKLIKEANERLMNEYSWQGISPVESEVRNRVRKVFYNWLSSDTPPFSEEYLYNPEYFDVLIKNIMKAINDTIHTKTRY